MAQTRRLRFATDSEFRRKTVSALLINRATPEATAARRNAALRDRLWEKGHAELRRPGSTAMQRAGRTRSATLLAWCPPHLRDEYRFLTKEKRVPIAEARRMIEEQNAADMARWRRSIGVARAELIGPSRQARLAATRFAVIYTLRAKFGVGISFSEIGRAMGGRDHKTICHGYRRAQALIAANPGFAEMVKRIDAEVGR